MPQEDVNTARSLETLCSICQEISDIEVPATRLCLQCKHYYCDAHASAVDGDYCDNCLRTTDVYTVATPLVDDEGVTHSGRAMKLTGEFWAAMQRDVRDMTEPELKAHVIALQQSVREIEVIRDYRRIALAHAENELETHQNGKLRRLRLIKDVKTGRLSIGALKARKSKPRDAVAAVMKSLKACGLTAEQIVQILQNAQVKP